MDRQDTENKLRLPLGSKAGGTAFTVLVIVAQVLILLASAIISLGSLAETEAAKYISVLVSPLAIGAVLAIMLATFKQPAKKLLPLKCHPKYYLLGVLLIFGLLFSLSWVNDLFIKLFELLGYTRRNSPLPDVTGWKIVPVLIAVAVIPAIMEEIMFRGILLNNIEEGVGSVRAIFLVGFCFSLYHTSVEQTIYQFICGCLFAFLAVRSRSIAPTVVIHFLNNALIIILTACGLVDGVSGNLIIPQIAQIILYVLSGISLVGAVVWLILDKTELKKCGDGQVKSFFIFAAIGIAALSILWVVGLF